MDTNSDIFELLESKRILTGKNVSDIREYISKKYPNYSPEKNTLIFADTVNKIIENQLLHFNTTNRSMLKKHILDNTLRKKTFSITAKDVFHACTEVYKDNEDIIVEFESFSEKIIGSRIPKDVFYIDKKGLSSNISKETLPVENIDPENDYVSLQEETFEYEESINHAELLRSQESLYTTEFLNIDEPGIYEYILNNDGTIDNEEMPGIAETADNEEIPSIAETTADEELPDIVEKPKDKISDIQEPIVNEKISCIMKVNKLKELYIKIEQSLLKDKVLLLFTKFFTYAKRFKNFNYTFYLKKFFMLLEHISLKIKIASFCIAVIISLINISLYDTNNVSFAINENGMPLSDSGKQEPESGDSSYFIDAVKHYVDKFAQAQRNELTKGITLKKHTSINELKDKSVKKMEMLATGYDLSVESCGKNLKDPQYGITALGTRATVGRTIAVNPSVIPLGSTVYIEFPENYSNLNGIYIAEDISRYDSDNMIDIFLGEDNNKESTIHNKVVNFGINKVVVYFE